MSIYTATLDRLLDLPEVFDLPMLMRLGGVEPASASVYVSRWIKRGLIAQAGERAGVYFNLLRSREVTGDMRMTALRHVYPSSILAGESVLHLASWTTQYPRQTSIAVLSRRSYPSLHEFAIMGRSKTWFQRAYEHGMLLDPSKVEFPTYGLKTLAPAAALVDLYQDAKAWHPAPDDLDIPDAAWPDIRRACVAFAVPMPEQLQASQPRKRRDCEAS